LPDEATLAAMSAKDLKRLLASHKVDTTGCIEKADYVKEVRLLLTSA